ncbi:MAG: type II toxin-antitoxin system RelB/DinJ family antitoxin [Synergistaceae bacterium]|jgi:addiction module RelB/DinJ family antitoxin|nr:type II toxin-antitoxin system RelB/DinJ family antitoxin [Synergistaceae bacterium]
MAQIRVSVDDDMKARAEAVFGSHGLSIEQALEVFVNLTSRGNRLPFDEAMLREPKPPLTPAFGCMRGKIRVADDFDAPLEFAERG